MLDRWNRLNRPARIALIVLAVLAACVLPELAMLMQLGGPELVAWFVLAAVTPLLRGLRRLIDECVLLLQAARTVCRASHLRQPSGYWLSVAATVAGAAVLGCACYSPLFMLPAMWPAS